MSKLTTPSRLLLGCLITLALVALVVIASPRFSRSNTTGGSSLIGQDSLLPVSRGSRPGRSLASSARWAEVGSGGDSQLGTEVGAQGRTPQPQGAGAGEPGTDQEKAADSKDPQQEKPLRDLSKRFARRKAAAQQGKEKPVEAAAPPADEIVKPLVALSQEHRDTCLVVVGDSFPDITLPDVDGKRHSLKATLGARLTTVIFWNSHNLFALDQFTQTSMELGPLKKSGVQTVTIHVGKPPENYAKLCQQFGKSSLCLLDADEKAFHTVAKRKLPRTYLLDADGKILWFDIEYSRATRYDLRNALHFYLRDKPPAAPPKGAAKPPKK